MKTVIVPSNGKSPFIENYSAVNEAYQGEMVHYIFLDVRALPDNYNDLITISRDRDRHGCFTNEFCKAVEDLAVTGQQFTASVDHIYGDSVPVFRNYIEYRSADLVIFDQSQWSGHPNFQESEIFKMIMRSGAEVLFIPSPKSNDTGGDLRTNARIMRSQRSLAGNAGITTAVASGGFDNATSTAAAPASVVVSYVSVDKMLNDLQSRVLSENILIYQISKLRRYFLNPSSARRMLLESNRQLLWLSK